MTYPPPPGQPEPAGQPQSPAWPDPTAPQQPAGYPPPGQYGADPYATGVPPVSSPTAPYAGYAQPPATYPPAGYQAPYGVPVGAAPTNGMAIASLVTAVLGLGFIAAILGHMARRQIQEHGEQGDGLALAGIIIGWVTTAFWVLCCGGYALAVAGMFGTSFASTY